MKKSVTFLFIVVGALALALVIGRARANPGDLDPTWGDGGVARFAFTENDHIMSTGQLDPDDRAVLVGWVDGYPGAFGVARLRADGSLDTSFGTDGRVMTRFSANPELPNSAWSVSSRLSGGYLVAGEICDVDYVVCEWVSAAYRADGTLDPAFGGGDGWITTTVAGADGVYAWPPRNITQPDGKILVGGIVVQPDGDIDLAVRRHNLDGSLDAIYGDAGIAVYDFDGLGNYVEDMSLLPDGKLLIAGGTGEVIDPFNYTLDSAFLLRLHPDGSIDGTFGDEGLVVWDGNGRGATSESLGVSSGGDIFVAGGLGGPSGEVIDCGVWRFNAVGNMDMNFGDGGQLVIDTGLDEICLSLALMADGRLALSGQVLPATAERAAGGRPYSRGATGRSAQAGETLDSLVARAYPGGTLDVAFGDGGVVVHDIEESDNYGIMALAQPDGRILVLGDVPNAGAATPGFAVSRFQGDAWPTVGKLDPTWGQAGVVHTDFAGLDDTATTQVLMPDGKLVAAGWVNSYPGDFGVVRYLRNGRLDSSFGDGGRVVTAFSDDPELVDAAWGINARPDGGLHLFGETCDADYIVCRFALAAYLADGSLDESFGDGGLVTTPIPDAETAIAWPSRNILQADGKVVAGGLALFENNQADIVLLRYNSDGSLDESFGDGGISVIDFEGKAQFPQDIVALPGDKIMIVGGVADEFEFTPFFKEAFMARINSDGLVDSSFGGGDGYITWTLGGEPLGFDRALVTSASEMFIVGGDETDCTLQRFDLDGTLDTTFGDDGWVIIDSGQLDLCPDASLTVDGKIALVGRASSPESDSGAATLGRNHNRAAVRGAGPVESSPATVQEEAFFDHIVGRYNADGTPDATFGDDGLVRFTVNDGEGVYSNISAQQDGRLLVVGDVYVDEQLDVSVVRFLGDGPAARTFMPVVRR